MQWQKSMQLADANVLLRYPLDDSSCTEMECVLCAIAIYASISLDFVDCLRIAYHRINSEHVVTYDKKLIKYLNKE